MAAPDLIHPTATGPDIMDRIVRQIDDAEAHAMTLLRLVLAATLALGLLGLAAHLLA